MNISKIGRTKKLFFSCILIATAILNTSCGESSTQLEIPGVDGPTLTLEQDSLLIDMTFENIQLDGGLRYSIPQYNNSYIEIGSDDYSDGTLMSIHVSLDDILNTDLLLRDPQKLPGDRNLPGVSSGSLPAVAFSIPNWDNMTFYLGEAYFGVFVPVSGLDIGTNNIITARFYTGETASGNISLVGTDENGENGGFVLLLDLTSTVKSKIKEIVKIY